MRIAASVTSLSWLPSEAIEGMPKLPFELGIARYDEPPPDRIDDLDALHASDGFRVANELRAWIEVEDGDVVTYGHEGRVLLCPPRVALGPRSLAFPVAEFPLLRPEPEPELGGRRVRFVQTAGGRIGLPAPRRVLARPYFLISSPVAWTTLELVLDATGETHASLTGASPFPRHWVYDAGGRLFQKSGAIDFEGWYRETLDETTPWAGQDVGTLSTAVESALERRLAKDVMRRKKLQRRFLEPGETLVEQGEAGSDVFLLLDGVLDVEVGGDVVAQLGPGAVVGERAALEAGTRTATLRALTPCRAVVVPLDALSTDDVVELASTHRREEPS